MQIKSIVECSNGCILQYFRPELSYHLSLRFLYCLIWFFTSHQQSFSWAGTGLPGLNQYWARIHVSCSRTTMQWHRWGSNPPPLGLESSTLPLSHCTPIKNFVLSILRGGFKQVLLCSWASYLKHCQWDETHVQIMKFSFCLNMDFNLKIPWLGCMT